MSNDQKVMFDGINVPKIEACVMHPMVPALERRALNVKKEGFQGAWYGLCAGCINNLRKDSNYQVHIENEINVRVKQLSQQTEGI